MDNIPKHVKDYWRREWGWSEKQIKEKEMEFSRSMSAPQPFRPSRKRALSFAQATEIRKLKEEKDWSNQRIANEYGVPVHVIRDIVAGRTYRR